MIVVDDGQLCPFAFTRSYWFQRRNALTSRLFQLYNETGMHLPYNSYLMWSHVAHYHVVQAGWSRCPCNFNPQVYLQTTTVLMHAAQE